MTIRAKEQSTAEAFETMHNDLMLDRRIATPGKIVAINIGDNASLKSIDVQPLIFQVISAENGIESTLKALPIIKKVPVVQPRAQNAGFSLTQPISIGDNVLLVVSDRAIDNWQAKGDIAPPVEPVTPRAHDLTDAIAIIGLSNDMTPIENYNFEKTTLRNEDGTIAVEVSDDDVVIKQGDVNVTVGASDITMTNGTSSITITSTSITISADTVEIAGNQFNMASSANTATNADVVGNTGVSLNTHVHEIIDPSPGEEVTPPIP